MPHAKARRGRHEVISWRLRSGEIVLDSTPSHVHEGVREHLERLFGATESRNQEYLTRVMDFRYPVGLSTVVPTYPGEEIVFARRPGRRHPSRFVRGREASWTQYITAHMKWQGAAYDLLTAHFGEPAPREPWGDDRATPRERQFWNEHAFVLGAEPIIPGSEVRLSSRRR